MLGSFSDSLGFSPKVFQKIFGKNIDGVAKRVLLRPSQDGAPAKAEDVTDQGGEISVLLQFFSGSFFGNFREKC